MIQPIVNWITTSKHTSASYRLTPKLTTRYNDTAVTSRKPINLMHTSYHTNVTFCVLQRFNHLQSFKCCNDSFDPAITVLRRRTI